MEASRSTVPDVVSRPAGQVGRPIPKAVRAGWYRNMGFISEVSPGQFLRLIRRRKWTLILPVLILPVLAFIGATQITPRYTATTTVMVSSQQMGIPENEPVRGALPEPAMTVLLNQLEILQSRAIADRVIQQTGLMTNPEFNPTLRPHGPLEALLASFGRGVWMVPGRIGIGDRPEQAEDGLDAARLETIRSFQWALDVRLHGVTSGGIDISFTAQDPELASRVANAVADSYVIDQLQSNFDAVTRASQWLERRTAELREAVTAAEQAVEDYRASAGLVGGASSALITERISRLNRELVNAEAALTRAEARSEQIRANGAQALTPEVLRSSVIQQLRAQEARLRSTEAQLSVRLAFGNPRLAEVRSQIANVQRLIGAEVQRIGAATASELNAARARVETLQGNLAELRQQIVRNNAADITLRVLQREAENRRNVLQSTLALSDQVSQQANISGPITRILSRATPPQGPSYPQKKMIVAITILFSLVLGLLLICIRELLDQTFRSGDEVETVLGIPCLSLIPRVQKKAGMATVYDYVVNNPLSPFSETIRRLRTALWVCEPRPKSVVIASSRPREGRTMVAISLARLAALSGERVLLIDCDIRRPSTQRAFGGPGHKGLFNLLSGEAALDEVLQKDPASELRYIAAGSLRTDSANLMMSEAMTELIRGLGESYDLIVLTSPPLPALADAQVLARVADAVIYCVRWRWIGRATVLNGIRMLTASRVNLIGACLTRVGPRIHAGSGYSDPKRYQRGAALPLRQALPWHAGREVGRGATAGARGAASAAAVPPAARRDARDGGKSGAAGAAAGAAAAGWMAERGSLIERIRPNPSAGPAEAPGHAAAARPAAPPEQRVAGRSGECSRKAPAWRQRPRLIRTVMVAAGLAAGIAMAGALAMRHVVREDHAAPPTAIVPPLEATAAAPQGGPAPPSAAAAPDGTAATGDAAAVAAQGGATAAGTDRAAGPAEADSPARGWPLPPPRRPAPPRLDGPALRVADAAGREGVPVPLQITARPADPNGRDGLQVSITGLPAGAWLSAGSNKGGGRWVLRPAELPGLTLRLSPRLSGQFPLTVTATAAGGDEATAAVQTLTVAVAAVAIPPELRVGAAAGRQGEPIPLDIAVSPADPDGSEGLTIGIAGLPAGAVLSAGVDEGDGRWTLRPEDLPDLKLQLPAQFAGILGLTVTAKAWPVGGGNSAISARSLLVEVAAVALPPVLRVGDAIGRAGESLPLEVAVAQADPDRPERLSVTVDGLPAGAELSAGITTDGRRWTIGPEDLAGLTLRVPPQVTGHFPLSVAATAQVAGGDSATTTRTLALEVTPSPPASRPPIDPAALDRLMARGDGLISVGDVNSARLFYELAAAQGSPRAATMIGRSFDPGFLAEHRVPGVAGDRGKAMDWYRKGAEAGDPRAAELLQTLAARSER